ncbi:hypothetical protein HDU76_005767, partial [Blyttiomyces sp. JEL0837]
GLATATQNASLTFFPILVAYLVNADPTFRLTELFFFIVSTLGVLVTIWMHYYDITYLDSVLDKPSIRDGIDFTSPTGSAFGVDGNSENGDVSPEERKRREEEEVVRSARGRRWSVGGEGRVGRGRARGRGGWDLDDDDGDGGFSFAGLGRRVSNFVGGLRRSRGGGWVGVSHSESGRGVASSLGSLVEEGSSTRGTWLDWAHGVFVGRRGRYQALGADLSLEALDGGGGRSVEFGNLLLPFPLLSSFHPLHIYENKMKSTTAIQIVVAALAATVSTAMGAALPQGSGYYVPAPPPVTKTSTAADLASTSPATYTVGTNKACKPSSTTSYTPSSTMTTTALSTTPSKNGYYVPPPPPTTTTTDYSTSVDYSSTTTDNPSPIPQPDTATDTPIDTNTDAPSPIPQSETEIIVTVTETDTPTPIPTGVDNGGNNGGDTGNGGNGGQGSVDPRHITGCLTCNGELNWNSINPMDYVAAHNLVRGAYGLNPLSYNPQLEADAQAATYTLSTAVNCGSIPHDRDDLAAKGEGENLYGRSGTLAEGFTWADVVGQRFAGDEAVEYFYYSNGNQDPTAGWNNPDNKDIGHFTAKKKMKFTSITTLSAAIALINLPTILTAAVPQGLGNYAVPPPPVSTSTTLQISTTPSTTTTQYSSTTINTSATTTKTKKKCKATKSSGYSASAPTPTNDTNSTLSGFASGSNNDNIVSDGNLDNNPAPVPQPVDPNPAPVDNTNTNTDTNTAPVDNTDNTNTDSNHPVVVVVVDQPQPAPQPDPQPDPQPAPQPGPQPPAPIPQPPQPVDNVDPGNIRSCLSCGLSWNGDPMDYIGAHNLIRDAYGLNPLSYNPQLEADAKASTLKLSTTGTCGALLHDSDDLHAKGEGENLYGRSGTIGDGYDWGDVITQRFAGDEAVRYFQKSMGNLVPSYPGENHEGHFTQ